MTTELDHAETHSAILTSDVVRQIADNAADLDQGDRDTRVNLGLLARGGLLGTRSSWQS